MTITDIPAPEHAALFRDFHKIYDLTEITPGLPMPFTGPDRAAFWFTAIAHAGEARDAVATAKRIFGDALGAVFAHRDIWTENGPRRQYEALLASGLAVVLTAKTEHMQDEDDTEGAEADAEDLVAA